MPAGKAATAPREEPTPRCADLAGG